MQKLLFFALLIFAISIGENNAKKFRIVNGKNGLIENFPFQVSYSDFMPPDRAHE